MKVKWSGIIFLAVALLLTGCGKQSVNSSNDEKYSGYPVKSDKKLTYWMALDSNVSEQFQTFGDTEFAKELMKRTGIKVEYLHPVQGQTEQSLSLLIAADEMPDIIQHDWSRFQGGASVNIANGTIIELNQYMDMMPNLKKYLSVNPEIDKMIKTDEGKYYAFPFIRNDKLLSKATGPVVRRDWLKELSVSMPNTIGELEKMLIAFKNKGVTLPLSIKSGSFDELLTIFGAESEFYIQDGQICYGPLQEQYRFALETLCSWYEKGLLDKNYLLNDSKVLDSNILGNKTGMTICGGGGDLGRWLEAKKASNTEFDLVGIPYPKLNKEGNMFFRLMAEYPGNGSCAISSRCEDVNLALHFLDFAYSEDGYNLYNFGVEGKTYNVVDGKPVFTDMIYNNADGLSMSQAMGRWMRSVNQGPFVQSPDYITQYYYRPQQRESLNSWLENYDKVKAKQMPNVSLTIEENKEYSRIMVEAAKYIKEARASFINGTRDFNSYNDFLNTIRGLDIQKACDIMQSAYERYQNR